MCKQKQSTQFSQQQKSRAELKDYRMRRALLIAHCQPSTSDQGVNVIADGDEATLVWSTHPFNIWSR